jgi:hypothetical protein
LTPDRFDTHQLRCKAHAPGFEDDDDEGVAPAKEGPKRRGKKEIACQYCPMTFQHNHNFQFHVNQRHRPQLVEANWVACTNCPKLFETSARLQEPIL